MSTSGSVSIKAAVRNEFGKGAARRARRDGLIPVVLYGHGEDPRHLTLNYLDFAAVLRHHGTNAILSLQIDGTEQLALTKQIDVNPLHRNIEHADLLVIRKGEKVTVEVAISVEGDAAPGSLVTQDANYIEIEADALHIPESLTVSVDGIAAGTQITAADVKLPENVTLVSDPELLVVNIVEAPTEADLEATEDSDATAETASEGNGSAEDSK